MSRFIHPNLLLDYLFEITSLKRGFFMPSHLHFGGILL
nr:MAG TPA: hypothetical protein [Caudoviricetes sp.]